MNNLYNIIAILASSTEEDISLEELIWFKTYIVYLKPEMLAGIIEYIENYNFQMDIIKNKLIDYLNDIENIRLLHNQEPKSYQK